MVNNLGKFCRKLRIERGELLVDMARGLGVSSAFLSKVENGKSKPPYDWGEKIAELYSLNDNQKEELEKYIYEARNQNSIDMRNWKSSEREAMLSFARALREGQIDTPAFSQFVNKGVEK